MPDKPKIVVCVSGEFRAGKSVVVNALATLLRSNGIGATKSLTTTIYPPKVVETALAHLAGRGLQVEIIEVPEVPRPQIDATPKSFDIRPSA